MAHSRYINKVLVNLIPALALSISLSACSSQNSSQFRTAQATDRLLSSSGNSLNRASQEQFEALVRSSAVKSKILNQYANWKGVSYRLGGTTRHGIDCSAFVQRTFQDQFGIRLPRSTSEQRSIGKQVQRSALRPGDLVLFKTGRINRHIGIYIGENKFVHSSSSHGVSVSKLTDTYWSPRYWTSRRVI